MPTRHSPTQDGFASLTMGIGNWSSPPPPLQPACRLGAGPIGWQSPIFFQVRTRKAHHRHPPPRYSLRYGDKLVVSDNLTEVEEKCVIFCQELFLTPQERLEAAALE